MFISRADQLNDFGRMRAGRTALHCAVESHGRGTSTVPVDSSQTIRLLVDSGANLNKPVNSSSLYGNRFVRL